MHDVPDDLFAAAALDENDVPHMWMRRLLECAAMHGERLKEWMVARGVYPGDGETMRLSSGAYASFEDAVNLLQTMEYTRHGSGEKGRRLLGIEVADTEAETCGRKEIPIESATMTFDELSLKRCNSKHCKQNAEFCKYPLALFGREA